MSNAATTNDQGYLTVAYPYQGTVYNFTFYEGFVGRLLLRPQGGDEVVVYQQQGTYYVPQPPSGELRYPDVQSTVKIKGGPSELDIELGVDDGPQVKGRGPIKKIKLRARKAGGAADAQPKRQGGAKGPSVDILKGAAQVASLGFELKDGPTRGGVEALQTTPPGDDEVVVENDADTCPPNCKTP